MTLDLNKVYNENCLETMKRMPDNSVDSIVTDPPYGISFMGKKWDYEIPTVDIWKEVLRVLKPGGHLLCFSSTRTYHRMVCNIEDAGFEIRDQIAWVFGSGFPKSLNISKQIDKHFGHEIVYSDELPSAPNNGNYTGDRYKEKRITKFGIVQDQPQKNIPQSVDAIRFDGWGTALKPAHEPICIARKPLDGTVVQNVLRWGTGGLNIDECRVTTGEDTRRPSSGGDNGINQSSTFKIRERRVEDFVQPSGRFPSNFIHDGSDEVLELFPDSAGQQGDLLNHSRETESPTGIYSKMPPRHDVIARGDVGSAARFFYCAKASKIDRNEGTELLNFEKSIGHNRFDKCKNCGGYILQNQDRPSACKCELPSREDNVIRGNHHVTVKPTSLMRYLCRLITPPTGLVYDPFAGSGSTGKAAILEDFQFIGSELDNDYTEISNARIQYAIVNRDKLNEEYRLEHLEKIMPKTEKIDNGYF